MRTSFLERFAAPGAPMLDVVMGNHDCYYRNTHAVNALRELADRAEDRFTQVYDVVTHVMIDGLPVLYVPWITPATKEAALEAIRRSPARVVMGHLELSGFEVSRGRVMEGGMDAAVFKDFELVISGHYHHPSERGNVRYLGAPYEMIWTDHDDPRGFHVFDTDALQLEFVPNPRQMFAKAFYDDGGANVNDVLDHDFSQYAGKVVKVVVVERVNQLLFENFVREVERAAPADLLVVDDHHNRDAVTTQQVSAEVRGTEELIEGAVDDLQVDVDKVALRSLMRELYAEAQT